MPAVAVVRPLAVLVALGCLLRAARQLIVVARSSPRCNSAGRTPTASSVRAIALRSLVAVAGRWQRLRRPHLDAAVRRRHLLAPDAWPWRLTAIGDPADSGLTEAFGPPERLAALRLAAMTVGASLGLALLSAAGTATAIAMLFSACLALPALAVPDLATMTAARRGERSLLEQLPDFVDLLAASLAAGIPLEEALNACASQARSPLQAILDRARGRVVAGEGPAVALTTVAAHAGIDAFASVGRILEEARCQGVPAAPALRLAADDARSRTRATLLARTGRAGPLASLVLALVIAPACVLALVVAVLGGFSTSGGWTSLG